MRCLLPRDVLSPFTEAEFLGQYFGQKHLQSAGYPGRFAGLLPADSKAAVLLAHHWERLLECPVSLADYSSGGTGRGAEIILLQAAGWSSWEFGPGAGTISLLEGDALYLPAHYSWRAETGPGAAILALEIHNPSGGELWGFIADRIAKDPHWASAVPRFQGPGARANYLEHLQKAVWAEVGRPGLLERFAEHRSSHAMPRELPGVRWNVDLPQAWRVVMAVPRKLRVQSAAPEVIQVEFGGEAVYFPEDAAELLYFLEDHAPCSVNKFFAAFHDGYDLEELQDFLAVLDSKGVVTFIPPVGDEA